MNRGGAKPWNDTVVISEVNQGSQSQIPPSIIKPTGHPPQARRCVIRWIGNGLKYNRKPALPRTQTQGPMMIARIPESILGKITPCPEKKRSDAQRNADDHSGRGPSGIHIEMITGIARTPVNAGRNQLSSLAAATTAGAESALAVSSTRCSSWRSCSSLSGTRNSIRLLSTRICDIVASTRTTRSGG